MSLDSEDEFIEAENIVVVVPHDFLQLAGLEVVVDAFEDFLPKTLVLRKF
jgi:hypothetical protein